MSRDQCRPVETLKPFRVGFSKKRRECIAKQAIEYLVDKNRALREEIANQSMISTDDQRGRLAANSVCVG
jgi:hypothetical protein